MDDEDPVEAALRRLGICDGVSCRIEQFFCCDERPMAPKVPRRVGGQRVAVGFLDRRRAQRRFGEEERRHAQRADDHSRRHGPLLLYARDKPREELEKMTVDELQRELDTLAAQLEKDVATLKLKYAKRKQHLESVVRGKASYAAQGGGQ